MSPGEAELVDAAAAEFEGVVRRLPPDWSLLTPSDMSVHELVEHVVAGNRLTSLLLTGVERDEARAAVAGGQLADDPVAAVVTSAEQQSKAFGATPPDRMIEGPRGDVPVAAYLRFRLVDLTVHAWDLRRAAGLDETLSPTLVDGVLALVEPHLGEMLATGAYGDGPSGTLAADASPQHRLLDLFGRRP